jgi:hypothetical protein
MPATSSIPTIAFFGMAALFVLFKAWRGWRLGVVRQVSGLIAVIAAWVCGIFGGKLMAPLLHAVWPGPDRLLSVIGGIALGVAVFLVISVGSAVVFKKTEHQSVGILRLGFGFAGAAVGAAYGLVLVWIAILAVRLLGTAAEAQLAVEKNPHFRAKSAQPQHSPALSALAQVKRALGDGIVGALVQHIDPVPGSVYSTLGKLGRVIGDPASIERFTKYPGVKPLLDQPRIAALLADSQIQRAVRERNYVALFSNPRLVSAANDPDLGAALRRLDIEKALDFALKPSEPSKPREPR